MKIIRATYRLFMFANITLFLLIKLIIQENTRGRSFERRSQAKKNWARIMARLLGIEVGMSGEVPPQGVLLAPNHRSYIDIVPVNLYVPGVYLAKAEVSKWPLIGYAATYADTMWIWREERTSRQNMRSNVAAALKEGKNVVVHPEGTTVQAPKMNHFRPGIFYTLASEKLKVAPVAIEFKYAPDAWIGSDTFIPHFFSCFGKKKTPCRIHFGPVMEGDDPEELRKQVQEWVRNELASMREMLDFQEKYPS
ncbi:MAG: 1-acyl-sn-glycerol-3-phosphate acyltransferase [Bacteroidia bacterium]|nr:1-acyl-sn-glycerol-3-phosphate acyltransferase [Bacteroidia bacterium]